MQSNFKRVLRPIAEWENKDHILVGWPSRPDTWRSNAVPAQDQIIAFVGEILSHTTESISVLVNRNDAEALRRLSNVVEKLPQAKNRVSTLAIPTNDCWVRDTGCIWVSTNEHVVKGACFRFNAWGGSDSGCYQRYGDDILVGRHLCDHFSFPSVCIDFILEGGSITVDDYGTAITTEQTLLCSNRNPTFTKAQIEQVLHDALGIRLVLWLPFGLAHDADTDGHVDNMAMFIGRGHVLLSWTDAGENASRCESAYRVLSQSHDAEGNKLHIHKVDIPPTTVRTAEEANSLVVADGKRRPSEEVICSSYINILQTRKAVFVPACGFTESDRTACEQIQRACDSCSPVKKSVVPIQARELALAGGGLHCLTLQVPSLSSLSP